MGYYSEVGLCLNKAAHASMLKKLRTQNKQVKEEVKELLTDADKYLANPKTDEECVLYHWQWIKWYREFNEVKFIVNFIASLNDDDDSPLQYRFVRIGEEYEDVEVHGSFYENPFEMDLGRGVHINASFAPIKKNSEKCV